MATDAQVEAYDSYDNRHQRWRDRREAAARDLTARLNALSDAMIEAANMGEDIIHGYGELPDDVWQGLRNAAGDLYEYTAGFYCAVRKRHVPGLLEVLDGLVEIAAARERGE